MPTLPLSILPKTKSPEEFELMCRDILNIWYEQHYIFNTGFRQYGCNGQAQNGIDLYAKVKGQLYVVAQCKNYHDENKADTLIKKMESDIKKIHEQEELKIKTLFLMTSYHIDKNVEDSVIHWREEYPFQIEILFWEDIQEIILENDLILKKYYPSYIKLDENLITLFDFALIGIQFSYIIFNNKRYFEYQPSERVRLFLHLNDVLLNCENFCKGEVWICNQLTKRRFSECFDKVYQFIHNLYSLSDYKYTALPTSDLCDTIYNYCVQIEQIIPTVADDLSPDQRILFSIGTELGLLHKRLHENIDLDLTKQIDSFKQLCRKWRFTDKQNQEIENLLELMIQETPSQEELSSEVDKENIVEYIHSILYYQTYPSTQI